ncbi:ATP-binding protein [Kitasatospora aureofaciens]|uniref:ATP-binding protein n=1 Tax=Kitasatospora aureofaciens TaxID=1894 RepID=UPI00131E51F9|nr:ATP-binding protein [Kitasatospora aureofaciens]
MSDLGQLPLGGNDASGGTPVEDEHPYTMTISRLTIDKLGIKLYDRVSAVLAELISNAYDADAERVEISLPWGAFLFDPKLPTASSMLEITIKDDGHGMTRGEMNQHYLTVGADRRTRPGGGDNSRGKGRPVMGRKGIGKLAPFGICKTVEIISSGGERTKRGYATSHIILHLPDMLADTDREYHPIPGELDGCWSEHHGTTVKLRDFSRKRVPTKEDLDRQLAARFGLERSDWRVEVANSLDPRDSFVLGRLMIDLMAGTRIDLDGRPVPFNGTFLPVSGYVAYTTKPYKDEYMAGVRVYSRGKFVAQTRDFGIGAGFTGEFKLRSYIVGELHAEWLDEEEDLVRSDRQDIIWSSDLGEALAEWGKKLVKELARRSDEVARKEKTKLFMQASNLPAKLMESAPADPVYREAVTEAAELLVKDVDPDSLNNPEQVERIANLAVSLAPHRSLLEALREVAKTTETTVDAVMDLFKKARIAEMYSLGQVAAERLEVVSKLESLVADRLTLERPLQELIEQAPWILAPEWTPLGMNESLKRVRSSFESWYYKNTGIRVVTTTIENKAKEPDFVLLHDSGILWIVEIKRMGHRLTDPEYLNAIGYLESLSKYLDQNPELGDQFPVRRLTFVVDHVDGLNPGLASSLNSDPRINRRTWHELLDATKRSHKDFLARVESTRHEWDAAAEAPAPTSHIGEQRRSPEEEGRLI